MKPRGRGTEQLLFQDLGRAMVTLGLGGGGGEAGGLIIIGVLKDFCKGSFKGLGFGGVGLG